MNRLRLGMLSLAGFVWLGCSAASTNPITGTGGATGSGGSTGTGGFVTGTGGFVTGTGGVHTGTGGVVTGTGGIVTGTGGVVTGTGGVVAGTGGTSAGVECTGATTAEGYMDNGTLCGYAWTATNEKGETIDPPCGTDGGVCFTGATVCATATIPANDPPDYTGVMIGWNVQQKSGASSTSTWNATGTGITVAFNDGGATGVVRVIVQSANTDYCADAPSSPATFTWSDFHKECYNSPMGAAFAAGSPITAIAVQVNGEDVAQSLTNFCLTSVTNN